MASSLLTASQYPGGIIAMDSGLFGERMACCYLVQERGEAAIIEAGGDVSVDRMMSLLAWRGIRPEQVRYVIVTHVHLDHAGGAGRLMQLLPGATLLVHPRGVRHMIDPSKLEAGSRAVYGDDLYDQLYGALVPVDASRICEMHDGEEVELGTRTFRFIDTPGHARHHFCVHDSRTNGWFSGDTFGLSYRQLDTERGPFIFPTSTPIDFNPQDLLASMERLAEVRPQSIYLTHYGRIPYTPELAEQLAEGVRELERIGLLLEHDENRVDCIREAFSSWLIARARAHGVDLPDERLMDTLQGDIELNTLGVDVWLKRCSPLS